MTPRGIPDYLEPYLAAARRHGDGFGALLWTSPETQAARFDALARIIDFNERTILDVGCGRADLLDYLLQRQIHPAHYTGLEALEPLATAAERKRRRNCLIVRADFVAQPHRLLTGADVVVFCGSLNTLDQHLFFSTLRVAHEAAAEELAINFLCSPRLAGNSYLHWHRPDDVAGFLEDLGGTTEIVDDYLEGDCTITLRK